MRCDLPTGQVGVAWGAARRAWWERLLSREDLRVDRGTLDLVDESTGGIIDTVPAPIAVLAASRSLPHV